MKASTIQNASQKPIEIEDFYRFAFLSGLNYAPSGEKAVFVKSWMNKEENKYESDLYLFKDNKSLPLTSDKETSLYIFDNEETILFVSYRDSKDKERIKNKEEFTPFYRLSLSGGEAIKAFEVPYLVSSIKKIGEGQYIFSSSLDLNSPSFYRMNQEDKEKIIKKRKEEEDYEVLDETPFWVNGGTVINKKRSCLYFFDEKNKTSLLINKPSMQVGAFDYANGVLYFAASDQKVVMTMQSGLYSYNFKLKKSKLLIKPLYTIYDVKVFNGQILLAMSDNKSYGLNQNPALYLYSSANDRLTLWKEIDEEVYGMVGSDCHYGRGTSTRVVDNSYYYITTCRNRSVLRKIDKDGNISTPIDKEGSLNDFDVNKDKFLVLGDYDMRLNELYSASIVDNRLKKVTSFNDDALEGKYVAKPIKMTIKSEGYDIDGWVLFPQNVNPKKKYPAILDIHGGPKTVYGEVYYHEMQVWANKGFYVFFANPFGGAGRGDSFSDMRGKYGSVDYQNLMDFTDAVLEKYPNIDAKRVCVTGGSYGGFMTNWIITHTDRFVAACTQRSISNWVSMSGISDIGMDFSSDQCNGNLYTEEGVSALWEHSPLKYINNAKTPTLVIHSDCDYRCPIAEGYQLYTALAYKGVEARMVVFHGENHELSRSGKPLHRERRMKEITDWFVSHTVLGA